MVLFKAINSKRAATFYARLITKKTQICHQCVQSAKKSAIFADGQRCLKLKNNNIWKSKSLTALTLRKEKAHHC